jgi:hypothetical protein
LEEKNLSSLSDILLISPPFTQLNTPYPATAYIKGFLNTKSIPSFQIDLGLEVILHLFSKEGLTAIFQQAAHNNSITDDNSRRIYGLNQQYIDTIDAVIAFLQGHNPTLARLICSDQFLPEASRFAQVDDLEWAFGTMGHQDKAKHLATLYLEDISDFIIACIDPYFGFSRYAERLGRSANSFDELHDTLQQELTYIDKVTLHILSGKLKKIKPSLVCFSVPFPGNLYSAFRCAKYIKSIHPTMKIAMGGGFPNTELRDLSEPRVFEYFDYISLDDGELPIELIYSNVMHPHKDNPDFNLLKRTFVLENGAVLYNNYSIRKDYKHNATGTPDYSDLLLDKYISVIEIANPMHSLWSDGRWNKLTMAHGCYWGKCTFCDVSLDYIKVYEPIAASQLVDRMETLIDQTNERGFHFVDEAAPPSLMREVALEILRRKLAVSWWTNIRFEKSFSLDLCKLLQASGCIAVSGGLEVASDRLLEVIKKGVTVEQVARVTRNFTSTGIMVHAYLMYGYPTQTVQETIDSLEMVRQMFESGILQSGFWHQFALTAHSPIGMDPSSYGITPKYSEIKFANNDLEFSDSTGIDHNAFSYGLKKSLYNYMHGMCFEYGLQEWFDFIVPKTKVASDFIEQCLEVDDDYLAKPTSKIVWIGLSPMVSDTTKNSKGKSIPCKKMTFYNKASDYSITLSEEIAVWLIDLLGNIKFEYLTYAAIKEDYEKVTGSNFEMFWYSKEVDLLRSDGLLVL